MIAWCAAYDCAAHLKLLLSPGRPCDPLAIAVTVDEQTAAYGITDLVLKRRLLGA